MEHFYAWDRVVVILFILVVHCISSDRTGKIVETSLGKVRGIVSLSRQLREFYSWRGIPYAEPPVGQLRYASPVPVKPWKGVLNAMQYGDVCPQRYGGILLGSEDCLSLNVFTPVDAFEGNRSLPVMVFIHGGIFLFWSSQTFGPDYFMDEDVVLVTINYRLGAFGFLCTDDGVVRGNMGLKDQAVALRWIRANIQAFGGDPTKITIFGESAGALSVHYHMMSPMSRGLFNQGISESGVAMVPWGLTHDPANQARRFASILNCPTNNTEAMVTCLRGKSVHELVRIHDAAAFNSLYDFNIPHPNDLFFPVVEKIKDAEAFLTEHPSEILKRGDYDQVPWMAGVNSEEGLFLAIPFSMNPVLRHKMDRDWKSYSNHQFLLHNPEAATRSDEIRKFYMSNVDVSSIDSLPEYVKMMSDRFFFVPLYKALKIHASRAPTYSYHYAYKGPSIFNVLRKFNDRVPKMLGFAGAMVRNWVDVNVLRNPRRKHGAGHTDELMMLAPFANIYYVGRHHKDYGFSKDLVRLWVSFAWNHTAMKFRGLGVQAIESTQGEKLKVFEIDKKPRVIEFDLENQAKLWDFVEGSEASGM